MLDVKSQDISIPDTVVVLCTAPMSTPDLAQVLAEKLAACVTLLPGATSLYYWEGKLEQEYEVQMIFKNHRHTPASPSRLPEVTSSVSNA